jgi:hypothetical protein
MDNTRNFGTPGLAAQETFPNSLSFSMVWWRPVSDADSGGDG